MKRSNFLISFWETFEIILIAVVSVYLVRTFIFQPFVVSGASMEPNFSTQDYLVIDEVTYRLRGLERGDVIVFHYPLQPSTYFIKRVVGLPGETVTLNGPEVKIVSGGKEMLLGEDYLHGKKYSYGELEVKLKSDEYFVMGDNRNNSYDSRGWGSLEQKYIVGIARVRLWPLSKLELFHE